MTSAMPSVPETMMENRTFDAILVGDSASLSRRVSQQDIDLFALATGDINPAPMDPAYAKSDVLHGVIAHGILGAGLISSVLGTTLLGPGTIDLSQDLHFLHPVVIGDTITTTLTITEKRSDTGIVSAVAGRADILVAPDLEAGNMLAKELTFLSGADAAGLVIGARVPIILASRADGLRTRLASCAVTVLVARAAAERTTLANDAA